LVFPHGRSDCRLSGGLRWRRVEANRQVVLRYTTPHGELDDEANPNGSVNAIAGVCNEARNVVGMMPHPERACEVLLVRSIEVE